MQNFVLFSAESGLRKLKDEPQFKSLPGQPLGNPLLCNIECYHNTVIFLEMADHHDACQELKGLSQEELISLGGELGLSYPRLKEMTGPLSEEMVAAWLSKEDTVLQRTGKPTWRSLADALKRNGHTDVANKIIRERVEMESKQG